MNPTATRTAGLALLTAALLVPVAACGDTTTQGTASTSTANPASTSGTRTAATYPVKVADCGREVSIDAAPKRVLTIGSAAIALLDAAGAADRIVARSGEFGAELPAGIAHPPTSAKIVDANDPATEAILGANVDMVYGYGLFKAKADDLTKARIALLTVLGECGHDAGDGAGGATLKTIATDMRRLGTVFGTSDRAEAAAKTFDAETDKLTRASKDRGRVAWVYYFGPTDPVSAYGGQQIPADVLGRAGLTNVFGTEKPYFDTNMEALLAKNPDWVVLSYGLYGESKADAEKKFRAEPGADQLRAVKEGHLILVPGDASQPSPAALNGLRAIVKAVSPS